AEGRLGRLEDGAVCAEAEVVVGGEVDTSGRRTARALVDRGGEDHLGFVEARLLELLRLGREEREERVGHGAASAGGAPPVAPIGVGGLGASGVPPVAIDQTMAATQVCQESPCRSGASRQ